FHLQFLFRLLQAKDFLHWPHSHQRFSLHLRLLFYVRNFSLILWNTFSVVSLWYMILSTRFRPLRATSAHRCHMILRTALSALHWSDSAFESFVAFLPTPETNNGLKFHLVT